MPQWHYHDFKVSVMLEITVVMVGCICSVSQSTVVELHSSIQLCFICSV